MPHVFVIVNWHGVLWAVEQSFSYHINGVYAKHHNTKYYNTKY